MILPLITGKEVSATNVSLVITVAVVLPVSVFGVPLAVPTSTRVQLVVHPPAVPGVPPDAT